jgi:hypothetical protein
MDQRLHHWLSEIGATARIDRQQALLLGSAFFGASEFDEHLAGYRVLIDASLESSWALTPDGQVAYERWVEYTSLPTGARGDIGWLGVFHPEDTDLPVGTRTASIESGQPYEMKVRLRRAYGTYRTFTVRLSLGRPHSSSTVSEGIPA